MLRQAGESSSTTLPACITSTRSESKMVFSLWTADTRTHISGAEELHTLLHLPSRTGSRHAQHSLCTQGHATVQFTRQLLSTIEIQDVSILTAKLLSCFCLSIQLMAHSKLNGVEQPQVQNPIILSPSVVLYPISVLLGKRLGPFPTQSCFTFCHSLLCWFSSVIALSSKRV